MDLENKSITVSRRAARLFLLRKQLLWPPHTLSGQRGIKTVFETLRTIQYDPLNPCGRNTDLVLQSRMRNIHPDAYIDWLYAKRKGVEYYDKELCILPTQDLAYCAAVHEENDGSAIGTFLKKHKQELARLLRRIRTNGPISSLDLMDSRKDDIWWGPMHWGKNAVDSLWRAGKLVIAYRKNGRKYYDVPHNVYGKPLRMRKRLSEKRFLGSIARRLRAASMLPASGAGTGWLGLKNNRQLAKGIERLIKKNILTKVRVEGCPKPFVIRAEDKKIFLAMERSHGARTSMVFLAPLDNLLWDRDMIEQLFGFRYRWEVYTPKHKRAHGYYVLPILCGDAFVGRIEPILKGDTLVIKGFWEEPKTAWNSAMRAKLHVTIADFQRYTRAKRTVWECKKP